MIGGLRQGTRVVPLAAIALGAIAWLCAAKAQPKGRSRSSSCVSKAARSPMACAACVTEGDRVRLRWTADAPTIVHLHGYDIEQEVAPAG